MTLVKLVKLKGSVMSINVIHCVDITIRNAKVGGSTPLTGTM